MPSQAHGAVRGGLVGSSDRFDELQGGEARPRAGIPGVTTGMDTKMGTAAPSAVAPWGVRNASETSQPPGEKARSSGGKSRGYADLFY
jgi:hypothetical protein